jgi:hypothetical protein
MRVALLTLLVLGATAALPVAADSQGSPPPPKPSSLAPHGHPGSQVYGAPIQPRILGHVYRAPRKSTARTHS